MPSGDRNRDGNAGDSDGVTVMVTASASATVDGRHQAAGRHQAVGGNGNGGE